MKAIVGLALAVLCPAVSLAQPRERLPIEQLRMFTEVYGAIRANSLQSVEHEVLVRQAIEGLLRVDPHGAYYDAQEFSELQRGVAPGLGGVGLEIIERRGILRIVSAIEDSPAARAGLKADDVLVRIDDVDLQDKRTGDAVKLMRGKPGTTLRLTIERRGEPAPREVTLARELIRVRPVKSRMVGPGVAYVRVGQFTESAPATMAKEIAALFAGGEARAVVLDLRSSPGGLLHSCIAAAALFLPENALILKMDGRTPENKREFRAVPQDYLRTAGQADPRQLLPAQARTVPIAVLVDRGTASGSEFVAAALREHKRAILVGRQTFGRGTVQTIFPLVPSGAIKLTTGVYESPNGAPFEGVGLKPDIEVADEVAIADFGSPADPVLRAALEKLLR